MRYRNAPAGSPWTTRGGRFHRFMVIFGGRVFCFRPCSFSGWGFFDIIAKIERRGGLQLEFINLLHQWVNYKFW